MHCDSFDLHGSLPLLIIDECGHAPFNFLHSLKAFVSATEPDSLPLPLFPSRPHAAPSTMLFISFSYRSEPPYSACGLVPASTGSPLPPRACSGPPFAITPSSFPGILSIFLIESINRTIFCFYPPPAAPIPTRLRACGESSARASVVLPVCCLCLLIFFVLFFRSLIPVGSCCVQAPSFSPSLSQVGSHDYLPLRCASGKHT